MARLTEEMVIARSKQSDLAAIKKLNSKYYVLITKFLFPKLARTKRKKDILTTEQTASKVWSKIWKQLFKDTLESCLEEPSSERYRYDDDSMRSDGKK
uniref:Uncharacterized protein n=1 Tax=Anopheles minimus TaxID=112268 RepID=A0A182WHZ8_9DIPT